MARAVRGASGTVTTLPPLRRMVRARWAALQSERLNVGPSGFGDPEPVQGEQENEGVLGGGAEAGGHEQRSDFVAVKSGGVGLVVDPGAPHVHRRRMVQELLLHGVAVEAGHRAKPAADGGPGTSLGLEVPAEALDVGSARREQVSAVAGAPGQELAQVQGVGVSGEPAVSGQEAGQG